MIYVISILLLVSLYVNWNIFRKNEKLEEANEESYDFVLANRNALVQILRKVESIDSKKMFQEDDEVGTTFKMIKDEISRLEETFDNEK